MRPSERGMHAAAAGSGAVQKVSRLDCNTLLVVGYLPPPGSPAAQIGLTLALINGSLPSPCGDTFEGASLTASMPARCACSCHRHTYICRNSCL